jgi:hypothetical protein
MQLHPKATMLVTAAGFAALVPPVCTAQLEGVAHAEETAEQADAQRRYEGRYGDRYGYDDLYDDDRYGYDRWRRLHRRRSCAGFAGLSCPRSLVCVDDPYDSCDPGRGDTDCGGICVEPRDVTSGCDDPGRSYISSDPTECAATLFDCGGEQEFFDECGCGCLIGIGDDAETCGPNVCDAGEYCCNESCGVCAPHGGSCTRQICPDFWSSTS